MSLDYLTRMKMLLKYIEMADNISIADLMPCMNVKCEGPSKKRTFPASPVEGESHEISNQSNGRLIKNGETLMDKVIH